MATDRVEIRSEQIAVQCEEGRALRIEDRLRNQVWELAPGSEEESQAVEQESARSLRQTTRAGENRVERLWTLADDGIVVETRLKSEADTFEGIAIPGSFRPASGTLELALPVMQGVLLRGGGEPFERRLGYGGHVAMSMAMLGYLGGRGGLLVSPEDPVDWRAVAGVAEGEPFARFEAIASLGRFRYRRRVCIQMTDPSTTAVCKAYRRLVMARGEWKSWAEKLDEKPGLHRLFGALMAFIGYNAGRFDYAAECRKLKEYGFDRAFVYPVRFSTYSQDFQMGGDTPIHLDDATIGQMLEMGYDVAPWAWVVEALDDGRPEIHAGYRQSKDGQRVAGWKIDDYQWYRCCTPFQTGFVRTSYEGPMGDMTWTHFDVNASIGPQECWALDHASHLGRALDRRADLVYLKELLGSEANSARVVSSEGFQDSLAARYDIGTTKLLPSWGAARCRTVPMTALVYHDSLVHDWWEVHNYNAAGRFDNTNPFGRQVDGFPREKAAMDALCGWPPNVFPFGRQYRWVDFQTRQTESYTVHFEDAAVQEALAAALPVAQLHRRIGQLEMLTHAFLNEDGSVQETTFADGTRVVANFGTEPFGDASAGAVEREGWKAGRARGA